jgi:hypothetical protein
VNIPPSERPARNIEELMQEDDPQPATRPATSYGFIGVAVALFAAAVGLMLSL